MRDDMMPAWKAALLTFVVLFIVLVIYLGVSDDKDGEELGQSAAPALIFAPLVAYIVQKTRIGSGPPDKL